MVTWVTLVQSGRSQLVAAVVAQNPLLLLRGEAGIWDSDVEPASAVAAVRAGTVVGRIRDDRPHERRSWNHPERRLGDRRELPLRHEVAGARHLPGVGVH